MLNMKIAVKLSNLVRQHYKCVYLIIYVEILVFVLIKVRTSSALDSNKWLFKTTCVKTTGLHMDNYTVLRFRHP